MLPKEDRKAMLLRLFNDESELVDNSRERNKNAEAKADTEKAEVKNDAEEGDVPLNGDVTASLEDIADDEEVGIQLDGDFSEAIAVGEAGLNEKEDDEAVSATV